MSKRTTIKCPHCGQEYLAAEIYYPKEFLGEPRNIVRDTTGAVIGFDGHDMNTQEEYCCDKCGKNFKVDAVISFKVEKINDIFEDEDETW